MTFLPGGREKVFICLLVLFWKVLAKEAFGSPRRPVLASSGFLVGRRLVESVLSQAQGDLGPILKSLKQLAFLGQ